MALLGLCRGARALRYGAQALRSGTRVLRCGVRALAAVSGLFLVPVGRGYFLVPVGELLVAVASPVAEHRL